MEDLKKKTKINFAVISLPGALVVYENAQRALMDGLDEIRELFYRMPLFSAQHSILNIGPNILNAITSIQAFQRDYCFESFLKYFRRIEAP